MIVGNKVDMEHYREIDTETAKNFVEKTFNAFYIETSAKDGTNVETAFSTVVNKAIKLRK